MFTPTRSCSLYQATWIQSTPSHPMSLTSILILSSADRSSEWSPPFRFSDKNSVLISHLLRACHMPSLSHSPWLGEAYKSWSYSCSVLQPPATCSLLGPNILLSPLFSNTLGLQVDTIKVENSLIKEEKQLRLLSNPDGGNYFCSGVKNDPGPEILVRKFP